MGTVAAKVCFGVLKSLHRDEDGAAAIEYGLIIAGIALAIVGAVFAVGDDLSSVFNTIGSAVGSSTDQAN
jgi:pilus assembly protein Flp/PilA